MLFLSSDLTPLHPLRSLLAANQVTGGRDGCVRVWDPRVSNPVVRVEPRDGEVTITASSFSPLLLSTVAKPLHLYHILGPSPGVESIRFDRSSTLSEE